MDCFGNAGSGSIFSVPIWMNNRDMSLIKTVPLGGDQRRNIAFRAEFYNLPNHTQFSSINNTLQFDLVSYQNWIAGKGNLVLSNSQFGRYTAPAIRGKSR